MSLNRACKKSFDYKVYNDTGNKVPKVRASAKMSKDSLDEKKLLELRIFDDIKNVYDSNVDLEELETVEEITEVLDEILLLNKQYRHVHVDLKYLMGDGYAGVYGEYAQRLEGMRQFISTLKKKIKSVNTAKVNSENDSLVTSLRVEESIFRDRVQKELEFELTNIVEIRENCSKLEHFLEDYYRLLSKAKIGLAGDFEKTFGTAFDDMIVLIRDKINQGKEAVTKIQSDLDETAAKAKAEHEQEVQKQFVVEQKFQAGVLLSEIKNRCDTLTLKCKSSVLANMTDHQLFERQKNMESLDNEMREIFGKVTAFSKIASMCGELKDEMLKEPEALQKKALGARNVFAKELHSIVTARDISEEKLKNLSGLTIELPKFQGYDSKIDIYTFKSEFEKLIQPKHQKRYWIDILKKIIWLGQHLFLLKKLRILTKSGKN